MANGYISTNKHWTKTTVRSTREGGFDVLLDENGR